MPAAFSRPRHSFRPRASAVRQRYADWIVARQSAAITTFDSSRTNRSAAANHNRSHATGSSPVNPPRAYLPQYGHRRTPTLGNPHETLMTL